MRIKLTSMFAAAALSGLLATTATKAQEETERPRDDRGTAAKIWAASDVHGMTVKNRQGEELGDIEDFVLDAKTGEIVYVAIAVGETLDLGGKLFAVPPSALTMTPGAEFIGMEARKADLEKAEGFNKDAWPNAPDKRWAKAGDRQEGDRQEGGDKEGGDKERQLVRVSKITGADIYGRNNEQVGEVNDLVLNTAEHKVAYVVLGHGGTAGIGEKYFAVPCEALQYKSQNQTFVINATAADFEGREGFTKDNWPTQADSRFKKFGSE